MTVSSYLTTTAITLTKNIVGSFFFLNDNYVGKLNVFQYLYTLLLYMPDYKEEPAGVEAMMPWSEFIKERCTSVMDTETPENRGQIPF